MSIEVSFTDKTLDRLLRTSIPVNALIEEIRKGEATAALLRDLYPARAELWDRLCPLLESVCRQTLEIGTHSMDTPDARTTWQSAFVQRISPTDMGSATSIMNEVFLNVKSHEFVATLPPDEYLKQCCIIEQTTNLRRKISANLETPNTQPSLLQQLGEGLMEHNDRFGVPRPTEDPDHDAVFDSLIAGNARIALIEHLQQERFKPYTNNPLLLVDLSSKAEQESSLKKFVGFLRHPIASLRNRNV